MVNTRIKRIISILMVCMCICAMSVPVYAETVDFNITVSSTSRIDPISKRAQKADDEQRCYVTVTGGAGSGVLRAHSEYLYGGKVSSYMYLSKDDIGTTKTRTYVSNAKAGEYYFLNTYWSSGTGEVNLLGRYTP